MKLTYRENVAIFVLNNEREILLCHRIDTDPRWKDLGGAWQIPQGGIDAGEDIAQAALRELKEEIGTDNVRILRTLEEPIKYDWPKELHSRGYIGQSQNYVQVLLNDESEINLNSHSKPEFNAIKWVTALEFPNYVSGIKGEAYLKALKLFTPPQDR